MDPYVKQGYIIRDDQWGGDLGLREQKAIPHTLFKGNDYWFCVGTDVENARVAIHLYDSKGKLAENDSWQKGRFAAARILALLPRVPIISLSKSPVRLKNGPPGQWFTATNERGLLHNARCVPVLLSNFCSASENLLCLYARL